VSANRVIQLERYAKYARGQGRDDIAANATERALQLRQGISLMNSGERGPLVAMDNTLTKMYAEMLKFGRKLDMVDVETSQ
jgi:hypothetical protein